MRIAIGCGLESLEIEVPEAKLVKVQRQPPSPPLADPAAATRAALENPLDFPALRRALTPDDHVVVIVDEHLPHLPEMVTAILEHLQAAQVSPRAVTLLCTSSDGNQPWLDGLPDAFQEARLEIHDPADRKRLSYLATTRQGRRIYLNRSVVDADQVVVLTGRGYDPALGYSGAEGALYPALADEAIRRDTSAKLSMDPPGPAPWPLRREAAEVAWLLGAPFLVQVIPGTGAEILHVVGGPVETSAEGQRLLDARWRVEVEAPADVVMAGIGGDPAQHSLDDIARAFACASRVVKPHGRIVLLCAAQPSLGPGGDLLRQAEDVASLMNSFRQHQGPQHESVFHWAHAAQRASLYLWSRLPGDVAEELFTVPLDQPGQVQKLIEGAATCLVLPDAHRTMAVVKGD
jgi:nickel-dependent lactate racemase